MAASNVFGSTNYASSVPKPGKPIRGVIAASYDIAVETIATTSLDDAGDTVALIPVPTGRVPLCAFLNSPDLDSGTNTLDADIVLRTTAKDGTVTDLIL